MVHIAKKDSGGFTFAVDEVEPASRRLADMPMFEALKKFLGGNLESCSSYHQTVLAGIHYQPLLAAVYQSFSMHLSLIHI